MTSRQCALAPCLTLFMCSMAAGGASADRATSVAVEVQATPLQTLSTATFSEGGYLAWSGPVLCDGDGNVYFLLVPTGQDAKDGPPAATSVVPRDVLRVSADGKKRVSFSPVASPKFASAAELTTIALGLDRNAALFMLVWARWRDNGDQAEQSGQYMLSFDQKGEYRSSVEIDWKDMLVHQFEVFGSGEFLLRGRGTHTAEQRLVILSAGGKLRDVEGWPGNFLDEPSPGSAPKFDHMVRGGDGRIYVTQEDVPKGGDVVYAISASGESERVFKLPRMRKNPKLMGWKAAGRYFAATYLDAARRLRDSSGEERGRWWVSVFSDVTDGAEPEATVYGPAPGPLLCYEHKGSRDRFIFVMDGAKLVTMSAR